MTGILLLNIESIRGCSWAESYLNFDRAILEERFYFVHAMLCVHVLMFVHRHIVYVIVSVCECVCMNEQVYLCAKICMWPEVDVTSQSVTTLLSETGSFSSFPVWDYRKPLSCSGFFKNSMWIKFRYSCLYNKPFTNWPIFQHLILSHLILVGFVATGRAIIQSVLGESPCFWFRGWNGMVFYTEFNQFCIQIIQLLTFSPSGFLNTTILDY